MTALNKLTLKEIQFIKSTFTREEKASLQQSFNFIKHKKLVISVQSNSIVLNFEDIVCCQAEGNYTLIFSKSGKKYIVSRTLKWVLRQLDHTFVRVHRSHVVNMLHVTKLNVMDGIINTISQRAIPVSRAYKKKVVELFKAY
ncbi:MAG: LytTR family DNA-binding domain-containing protein [Saprospiraceae bacterium]|nr:LytTR family DNA-binding domain-containing protein [Saprospiraceae bacterium]